jgi:dTMP kinase
MSPRYVAFEGPEGCGKSTQAALLAEALGAVLTRETGGTEIGERLRAVLHDPEVTTLDARAEALLIAADRAQHLAEVVGPALAAGRIVVSDRSVYSSLAYQGHGRRLPLDEIRRINDWALRGTWPELVVLLDVPDTELAARLARRELDRFEREDAAFHARVAAGFRTMAGADPDRFLVVEAGGRTIDDLAAEILERVTARGVTARTDAA